MWRVAALAITVAWQVGCYYGGELPLERGRLVDGPEGWQDATRATATAFGISNPPTFYFYGHESMNCADGGGFDYQGVGCVQGLQGIDGILIGLPRSGMRPSDTVIVHELAHWRWDDGGHANLSIWGPGGSHDTPAMHSPGTRVGDQNTSLRADGL